MATYFGYKTTKTNKSHMCFGCMKTIDPGQRIRHDVWKEQSKMINKYYCKDCQKLIDTQAVLKPDDGKPYNPMKGEFIQRFPQYFQPYFVDKYTDRDVRLNVLQDLQMTFISNFEILKYRLAKIFGFKKRYKFDFDDFQEFAKTYRYISNIAYFICSK